MSEPYAKIIADSVYRKGTRLTTMELRMHRFVLAEFNTHRIFSRNSASSRAIPVQKQVDRIHEDPAFPLSWPEEMPGMHGVEDIPVDKQWQAIGIWQGQMSHTFDSVEKLRDLEGYRLHKSVVNRLLEPFMWHTVVVTSTGWENFFAQRCSSLAQPEIRAVADLMKDEYETHSPEYLEETMWHLPYIHQEDWETVHKEYGKVRGNLGKSIYPTLVKISAARCARVSYLTQDGKRDISKDLELYGRLVSAKPPHWSPLEHVATPWKANRQEDILSFNGVNDGQSHMVTTRHLPRVGNLLGWRSLRVEVEQEQEAKTYT